MTKIKLMSVESAQAVLPGMNDVVNDLIHPNTMFYLRKKKWAISTHGVGVTTHYL